MIFLHGGWSGGPGPNTWLRDVAGSGSGTCEATATVHSSEDAFLFNWAQFSIPYVQSISSISIFLAPLGFFSIQKNKKIKTP